MGIIGYVNEKKAQFKAYKMQRLENKKEESLKELQYLRKEREVAELQNKVRQEKSAIRELRPQILNKFGENLKKNDIYSRKESYEKNTLGMQGTKTVDAFATKNPFDERANPKSKANPKKAKKAVSNAPVDTNVWRNQEMPKNVWR